MQLPIDDNAAATRAWVLSEFPRYKDRFGPRFGARAADAIALVDEGSTSQVFSGLTATEGMERATQVLTADALAWAAKLSSVTWLNVLRELPVDVFGREFLSQGSRENRRTVAEAISALSPAHLADDRKDYYPIGTVLRFVMLARAVANAYVFQRAAAKDVPLRFFSDRWPEYVEGDPRAEALFIHDQRLNDAKSLDWRSGTVAIDGLSSASPAEILVAPSPRDWSQGETAEAIPLALGKNTLLDWQFKLGAASLRVPRLMRNFAWSPRNLLPELLLNYAFKLLMASQEEVEEDLCRRGYINVGRALLDDALTDLREYEDVKDLENLFHRPGARALSNAEVLAAGECPPTLRPWYPAPTIRRWNSAIVSFDLYSNSQRVVSLLSPSNAGGKESDFRARDFEKEVQRVVDDSPWRPPSLLRDLVTKPLIRLDGSTVTDIDAIAVLDDTALLIDAKSLAAPGAFEGLHRPTRNTRNLLERAVVDWTRKIDLLRGQRRGRNYDFSGLAMLIPLVVTTGPHFVFLDLLEPPVWGELRPVTTLGELEAFLNITT